MGDRSRYDELDDAMAQRREQSLLENEIAGLQRQVRDIKREYDGDIDLLKRHMGRLEASQNNVMTMVDNVQAGWIRWSHRNARIGKLSG